MERRSFLRLAAVGSGFFAVGGLPRVVTGIAAARSKSIPEVDRLVLTNVVDNVYDIFAKGGKLRDLTVERTPFALGGAVPLLAEHGLALHLESVRGSERREILLDFSFTDDALFQNYRALRIDPTKADALVLSHGHVDHYGALPSLARTDEGKLKDGLRLYAGGEDTFCHRVVVTPDQRTLDYGQLDRGALEARGLEIVLAKEPTVIAGHAFTSGQIPRLTNFEKGLPAARLVAGPTGSACADSMHFPEGALKLETKPGELVVDTFQGEIATAYLVRDRGLVVISSCGHAGIINSVHQVQKATGVEKVHAIVGGFHLAPAPDEIVEKTVSAFVEIDPDYILPMHCSGQNTIMALQRDVPEKLILPSTGTRVIFGA
jgi:7,8-dihydropterin-6-yl-methyl-4-(beta-D-ribofuranosyl)aminobenzene 5'-phosphate synthase